MNIYELLTKHEGRRNKPYKCTGGKRTVGVGHNFDDNPLPPDIAAYLQKNGQITDEMIDRLLEADVRQATADCRVIFPEFDRFSDNRRMALIDFVFQLGFTKVRRFIHSVACINTNRWERASEQMRQSAWATKQTPKRAEEIIQMIENG